jgi:hypothetical protein
MRTLLTLTFAALALPVAALGGGFATAGVGPPSDGLGAGDTWHAKITLLQHGITPLQGVSPTITIRGPETRTFAARPTGEPGIYAADVVFPTAGSYTYEIDDGFSQVHSFAAVRILGPQAVPGGDGFPGWLIAPLAAAALALAGGVALARRRAGQGVPALD